jgi:3-oxoacyl-[acyl-carrier-protein] synthase-3
MAVLAARKALDNAGLTIKDIDVIICATATGDHQFPSTASFIHAGLDAGEIPAFDVAAACAGFLHGTTIALGLIHSGLYRHALVIGAETLTRFADSEDRTTAILFGDAAGAVVLGPASDGNSGVLHCEIGCDGTRADNIIVPAGGSKLPVSAVTVAERLHYMRMKGREVYKFAVVKMQELIDRALESACLAPSDLKLVIPHQSNLRIIESVRERLGLPMEKMAVNITRFGNTSAASILLSFDEARRDGTLGTGDHVLMVAIGAGLTWGSMLIRL